MSEKTDFGMTSEPFSPSTPRSNPGGCGKPAWIGCAIVILLLGVAALVFISQARDLFGWAMERFEEQVMQAVDGEVPDSEVERLRTAFRDATIAVQEGRADPLALQRLQEELASTMTDDTATLDRRQVEELTLALERVANGRAPDS